jgi:uncharacterized protein (TIGR00251 family)
MEPLLFRFYYVLEGESLEGAIRESKNGITINIDVSPGAKKTDVVSGYNEWRKAIIVKVRSPPKDGKANAEIIKEFEKLFGSKVEIVKGQTSSQKVLFVHNITKQKALELLESKWK